ncbi:MAG: hypothetical protein HZA89_14160 [Verrucomicrobia bacterium]|nr:hypothetical protein [Verrucomicrobiota bacterium]
MRNTNFHPRAARHFQLRSLLGLALMLAWAVVLHGEIVNIKFTGTIQRVDDPGYLFDDSIFGFGTPFEGFYTYDTSVTNSAAEPNHGYYECYTNTCGIVIKVGNYVFKTNPDHTWFAVETLDNVVGDTFLIRSYNNLCSQPLAVEHISWQLDGMVDSAFVASNTLPTIPPDLESFSQYFGLSISGDSRSESFFIRGEVETVEINPDVITNRPPVDINKAVEVTWPAALGQYYQVQTSTDSNEWSEVGGPILGDGTTMSVFLGRQHPKTEFRVMTVDRSGVTTDLLGETVSVRVSGTIRRVDNPTYLLDDSVADGVPFEGYYTYDTGAAVNEAAEPYHGLYQFFTNSCTVVIKVGDYVFMTRPDNVWIIVETVDSVAGDIFLIDSYNNLCSKMLPVENIQWQIDGAVSDFVVSNTLPTTLPDVSSFSQVTGLNITGGSGSNPFIIHGEVESVEMNTNTVANLPPVTLKDAVEVTWPSALGYFYQIQTARNMGTADWTKVGRPILGDGTIMSAFVTKEHPNQFFRVEIANRNGE